MKKLTLLAAIAVFCFSTLTSAQAPVRYFDLPKFTQAPTLDGDRATVADEWAGALEFPCSPSQIQLDGQEYGWRNIEQQSSEVSTNQLNENGETEVAGEGPHRRRFLFGDLAGVGRRCPILPHRG